MSGSNWSETSCVSPICETFTISFRGVVRKVKVLEDYQGPRSLCFVNKLQEDEEQSVSYLESGESFGEREFEVAVEDALRDRVEEDVAGGGNNEGGIFEQALCSGINGDGGTCMEIEDVVADTMQKDDFNMLLGRLLKSVSTLVPMCQVYAQVLTEGMKVLWGPWLNLKS